MKKIGALIAGLITVGIVGILSSGFNIPVSANSINELKETINLTIGGLVENETTTSSNSMIVENPGTAIYVVEKVVDGDTIKINYDGNLENVRLIGIDTPESVHPDQSKNTPEGDIASDYAKWVLEGKEITLEFDVDERDQYDRLLAYIYIDGKMFNKTLLEEGYAKLATYPPNVKYVDDFTKLQEDARVQKKGFWEGYFE